MVTHRWIRRFVGQHVQCHTPYGSFSGIVVQATKNHLILAPMHGLYRTERSSVPTVQADDATRQYPMGPGGPGGPGGPMGPGGPGSGWHMAIPLAAILGITALGLHWW